MDDSLDQRQPAFASTTSTDLLIGGKARPGRGERFTAVNPATAMPLGDFSGASIDDVEMACAGAARAFEAGLGHPPERSSALNRLADVMETAFDEVLAMVIDEVGTPVNTARPLQVGAPISLLRYFAGAALTERTSDLGVLAPDGVSRAVVRYRPAGPVAAVAAYNYPLLFAASKLGAAIAAGCPVVLLPSPKATLSTLLLVDLLRQAEIPSDWVSILAGGPDVAQSLVADRRMTRVSFTGSVEVGRQVGLNVVKDLRGAVLELGGKSPAILLPGVSLDEWGLAVHQRYLRNAGQGCGATTRLLVHESQRDDFLANAREVYDGVQVGDPWDEQTLVGPLITGEHRARVRDYVAGALDDGGCVMAGGGDRDTSEPGWFFNPHLLGNLENSARINQQEVFGPVATVQFYTDVNQALRIANDTAFGLGASVYGDLERGMELAEHLDVGTVTLNGAGELRPEAPMGGWKASGVGRENGEWGLREFLEPQVVQWPACEPYDAVAKYVTSRHGQQH